MTSPARGTALRIHRVMTRFAGPRPGRPQTDFDIVEVRRLLKTDLSTPQIAMQLGVGYAALVAFIRRRNLCNLKNRNNFITLQESLRKEELRE